MSQETIDAATTALSNGLILGLEQALNLAFNGVPFASTFNAFANSFVPPLASQITVADFELIAMYANTTFMVGFGIGASCLALILCTFFIFGKRREPSVFLRAIAASANLIALSMGVSNMTGAANMSMQVQGYGIGFFIIITLTTLTMALAWEVVESWDSKRKMAYKALSLLFCLIYGGGGYYAISDAVSSCPAGKMFAIRCFTLQLFIQWYRCTSMSLKACLGNAHLCLPISCNAHTRFATYNPFSSTNNRINTTKSKKCFQRGM